MYRRYGEKERDYYESSFEYLSRVKRITAMRGPIVADRSDYCSPHAVMDDIYALNMESTEPIIVTIDSSGGEINTGMVMYDFMGMSKAPLILVAHNCASMATLLLARGNERLVFPHSRFILHTPQAELFGSIEVLEKNVEIMQDMRDRLVKCYIDCGVTAGLGKDAPKEDIKKKLLSDIQNKEHYLNAEEAIEYGLVDRLIEPKDLWR